MPCEACLSQFTIFRRKRSCSCCSRFYCGNCVKERSKGSSKVLCARCSIFAKRPLVRTELLNLKPKDLIFYLQSKHISTAGCVEKEELVALILHHAQGDATSPNHSDTGSGFSSSGSPTDETAKTFDNIKQTCQNFFGSISENISDTFMGFDGRSTAAKNSTTTTTTANGHHHGNRSRSGSSAATAAGASGNITSQPRVTTRAMPTYASSSQQSQPQQPQQQRSASNNTATATAVPATTPERRNSRTANQQQQPSCSSTSTAPSSNSQTVSPVVSFDSTASPSRAATNNQPSTRAIEAAVCNNCECSDDEEFLTTYTSEILPKYSEADSNGHTNTPVPAMVTDNGNSLAAIGMQSRVAESSDLSNGNRDESLHSSFEELGAIGGISDDSKAATDTNSGNTDQWQMLDGSQRLSDESGDSGENNSPKMPSVAAHECDDAAFEQATSTAAAAAATATTTAGLPHPTKKVVRRRSESYLNRTRRVVLSDDELSPTAESGGASGLHALSEVDEALQRRAAGLALHCRRCGKNKLSIRQHVERMRRHLESSQMSEAEIKRELQAFLSYLEKRTMSMDSDDATETALVSPIATTGREVDVLAATTFGLNDSDGIHVYGSNAPSNELDTSRFINLADFVSLDELESLTVKQLKEVLMLNRIDYKGCCEKQELLERVTRLWRTLQKTPAVEKLPTDELCKICMDAPIECVILECGHMATCTNCGKVLSECPICRQYIVRVVRFFRA